MEEIEMLTKSQKLLAIAAVAAAISLGAVVKSALASGQVIPSATPAFTPQSQPVAAGEYEAKKLLVLMDADKSGTVSKKEFMDFMEAEFDRLDTNKDGGMDVMELEQWQRMQ